MGERYEVRYHSNGTEQGLWVEEWCDRCDRDARFRAGIALVALDPDHCPVDGTTLGFDGMDEPALFFHGGYGATRRTVVMYCRRCGWSITREVSSISPKARR